MSMGFVAGDAGAPAVGPGAEFASAEHEGYAIPGLDGIFFPLAAARADQRHAATSENFGLTLDRCLGVK